MKHLFMLFAVLLLVVPVSLAAEDAPVTTPQEAQEIPLTDLYRQVVNSVVSIQIVGEQDSIFTDGVFQASGSGFVVDTQGHIVTNNHVVEGANKIDITFYDGTFARADIVGTDPGSDLAVIKVNVDPAILHPVTFADSSQLQVGQEVVAIGHPFQQTWTMTTGIISALGRSNPNSGGTFSIAQMIQTDTAINPGNSGGPLLDRQGRVIGVNTMIFTETNSSSGVGFAVPANTVQRVYPELIARGRYQYTWLGIRGRAVNLDYIELMRLDATVRGVVVVEVIGNSPASAAGLRGSNDVVELSGVSYPVGGDVITAINGQPIRSMADMIGYLADNTRPGDQVRLSIIRDGAVQELTVTLEARPE